MRRPPSTTSPSPVPMCMPGWSRWTGRRCRSPRATWSSSPSCARTGRTRTRSGSPCSGTTTAATGSGRTRISAGPSCSCRPGVRRWAGRHAGRPISSSPTYAGLCPTISTPRPRLLPWMHGRPLPTTGTGTGTVRTSYDDSSTPSWASRSSPNLWSERLVRLRPAAALEVPLELAGDGFATGLGQLGRVARLLERPHVVANLFVLLGELVHATLPGLCLLRQVAARDAHLEQLLDLTEQRQCGLQAWWLGDVVGDGSPERHGRHVHLDAGVLEHPDDPCRPLVV